MASSSTPYLYHGLYSIPCKVLSLPFGQDRPDILRLGGIGFIVSWILNTTCYFDPIFRRRIRNVADHPNKELTKASWRSKQFCVRSGSSTSAT